MENLPVSCDDKDLSIYRDPTLVLEEAHKAAKALNDVISKKKKKVMFNGEQYLEFEDWQTVGKFYGVTVRADDAEPITIGDAHGFRSKATAMRAGEVISTATAYCMKDEPNWAKKPTFQLASMAQTRACAKALRNVLAWVVVLAGYKPTPWEELQDMAENGKEPPKTTSPNAPQQEIPPPHNPNPNPSEMKRLISEPQRKRFFAIAKGTGAADDVIKTWLKTNFGLDSSKDISVEIYEKVCTDAQKELPEFVGGE